MDTAHRTEISWRTDVLPPITRRALDELSHQAWLKRSRWYLAGGTAFAIAVGHRASVDLDFFTRESNFSAAKLLAHLPSQRWTTDQLLEGTIFGTYADAKVSFIASPLFIPRGPVHAYGAVRVLDVEDIAVMKIIAVSQRGRKRDFVDLYWYCAHRGKLIELLRRLPDQYPTVAHDYHHIIKSLVYFVDAEEDAMPKLFFSATWKQIRAFFEREVQTVARELLGLH